MAIYVPGKLTLRQQHVEKLLLDTYAGAAAAYSLRQLSTGVSSVVRVRRSSDNAELDFTADEVSNGTLTAWVGAGNDGFVRTWYDQSENGRHAEQTTLIYQPRIVISGALSLLGSKPAVDFDGDYMTAPSVNRALLENKLCMAFLFRTSSAGRVAPLAIQGKIQSGLPWVVPIIANYPVAGQVDAYFNGNARMNQSFTAANQSTLTAFKQLSGTYSRTLNGANAISVTTGSSGDSSGGGAYLWLGVAFWGFCPMKFPEIIVYDSDQSAALSAVEADINAHYAIY